MLALFAIFAPADAAIIVAAIIGTAGGIVGVGLPLWLTSRRGAAAAEQGRDAAISAARQMQRDSGLSFHDLTLDRLDRLAKRFDTQADEIRLTRELLTDVARRTTNTERRVAVIEERTRS